MKSSITMRRSIGWIPRQRKPVWMTAVLVNGTTIANFLSPEDAVEYAKKRYPLDAYTHDYSIHKVGSP